MLAALALHGGVLLVARNMSPLSLLKDSDQRALRLIEIELPAELPAELREPPRPPEDVGALPRPEADRAPDPRTARAILPSALSPGAASPRASETSAPEANPPPPGAPAQKPSQWNDLPPEEQGVLGVPGVPGLGRPIYTMPGVLPDDVRVGAPAPTVAPAPRPVDKDIAGKVIREAMASKDKEIGLDLPVAGSIRTAVRDAIMGTDLPDGAKGVVTCTVTPAGVVTKCRVQAAKGRDDSWAVATRAAAAVAGAALPGQYARGAVVTVNVSVDDTPPAGSKGGLSGAGANFDISNIGAHKTRRVKTSHTVVALP